MFQPSTAVERLAAVVFLVLAVSCVGPEAPGPEASPEGSVRSLTGSSPTSPGVADPPTDDDLEADDLEGLGELGVLPNLVQRALAPSADCDFDNALSTCQ